MIYTFLFGIDSIFRINSSFACFTALYFFTCVASIAGLILLRKNKSLLKNCLGFILVPAFPLNITLLNFGSELGRFSLRNYLICGSLCLFILLAGLIFIVIKTKNDCTERNRKSFFFIVLSGLMFFTSICIELISIFENFYNGGLIFFSLLFVVYYFLKVLVVRNNSNGVEKFSKINIIANVLFWVYIVMYDFSCFAMAAGSV